MNIIEKFEQIRYILMTGRYHKIPFVVKYGGDKYYMRKIIPELCTNKELNQSIHSFARDVIMDHSADIESIKVGNATFVKGKVNSLNKSSFKTTLKQAFWFDSNNNYEDNWKID